ncbi:MAG TPA: PHP domain-containing protein [Firmicutes bacterium]|nr:PHP domain-containing protein [Bacillota bacterium]
MRVTADYHTHTVYSHGKGSIEDNVRAALKRGLKAVGISDHGPGHLFIGVRGEGALRRMQKEIGEIRSKYPQIAVLCSVEANIVDLDGTIDVPEKILPALDLLLLGYHKLVRPRSMRAFFWLAANLLCGWLKLRPAWLRRLNTAAICAAVRRYPVTAVTHPGLQVDIDTAALAAVCRERGTLMEINSSYGEKLDGYVRTALPLGVSFLCSSDAHTPERVGDFAAAFALIRRLQVPAERIANVQADGEERQQE